MQAIDGGNGKAAYALGQMGISCGSKMEVIEPLIGALLPGTADGVVPL